MKTKFFAAIIVFVVSLSCLNAGLVESYKKGTIKIQPDPDFGKGTDWESMFFDDKKDLLVAPDGNIYVSNFTKHNIFKFSANGKLQGTLGKKGRGPGDLYNQGLNSCLDGKYLVLSEDPNLRKISIFDFSGKCAATIRTKTSCFEATGMKNGHIAYYSEKGSQVVKGGKNVSTINIHTYNIKTKKEKKFALGNVTRGVISLSSTYHFFPKNYFGSVVLQKSRDGNLIAGISDSPEIKIFSPDGKLVKKFKLNIKPVPITGKYIRDEKKALIDDLQNEVRNKELFKRIRRAVEKSDFKNFFGEHLPYYKKFIVDSEGNILVFKWHDPRKTGSNEIFQVYSPSGDFICETILDKGEFGLDIDAGFQRIYFSGNAVYGLFKLDDEDDIYIRLVKTKL